MTAPALFKRTGGEEFPDFLKVMLTGPPKSGKTSMLGTVPNIIVLDTEPHANNLQSIAHLNVPYATINSSDELQKTRLILRDPTMRQKLADQLGMPKVEAVAIDTLDSLQAILKRERMADQRTSKFLRDDWGWLKEEMKKIIEAFTALPMHVFFVVHVKTKDVGTEENPRTIYLPGLEGGLSEEIAGMVGYSLLSFRKQEIRPDGSPYTKYWLRAEGDETYEFLGNRAAGRLPDIVEPSFQAIYGAAMAGVAELRKNRPEPVQVDGAKVVQNQDHPVQQPAPAEQQAAPVAQPAPAQQQATPSGQPAATPPGNNEPMNATALTHVKKVYDAIGLEFPEDTIRSLNLGQARDLVRYWQACQSDAIEGKLDKPPAEEMTGYLDAQGWLSELDAKRFHGTEAPFDPNGTIDQILSWVNGTVERAQEAYDAEQQRAKPRATLLNALVQRGAVAPPPTPVEVDPEPVAVTQPAATAEANQVEEPQADDDQVERNALGVLADKLGAVPIDEDGKPKACEECGGQVDDEDIAGLSLSRFGRRLCVTDYIAETKKTH